MNIFIIDKATKKNLGLLDFIPHKEDRVVFKNSKQERIECIVTCVLYSPADCAVLVFVDIVESYYSAMISDIKWW